MATSRQVRALRGATTVERDESELLIAATEELLGELFERNGVELHDLVSMIFTATPDLRSDFPAVAARRLGIDDLPLLCARELDVPGAPQRCIRVLMHLYTSRDRSELRHVYLGGAKELRRDLAQ
jgi:chorismate mutase